MVGLINKKTIAAGKKGAKSLGETYKKSKAAKDAKKIAKDKLKDEGKIAKEAAKDKRKIRRGQKTIDRKTYGSGKKGKAAKAAAIAGKAADAKAEAAGMSDPTDTGMDGASMANPNTKKKRVKSKTERLSELKSPRRKGLKKEKKQKMKLTSKERYGYIKFNEDGASMMKKEGASMMKKEGASMSGEKYDAKQAYNKNLSASARLHYLENNRADKKAKGGSHRSTIMKHMKNI